MRIIVRENAEELSKIAAQQIIDGYTPGMRLGVATGSTPLGLYKALREAHAAGDFSMAGSSAWALDEYVGIPADHPERYFNVLHTELVKDGGVGLFEADLHTPDGGAEDPKVAAKEYDAAIAPGVDIQILGLGRNGHIGFNEPGGGLASRTHVDVLTASTREANARFFDNDMDRVPTFCVTQGLGTIMSAKKIVLLAFGTDKAEAVEQLIEGAVSQLWPATVLQHHVDVTVYIDEAAASRLELLDYYRTLEQL